MGGGGYDGIRCYVTSMGSVVSDSPFSSLSGSLESLSGKTRINHQWWHHSWHHFLPDSDEDWSNRSVQIWLLLLQVTPGHSSNQVTSVASLIHCVLRCSLVTCRINYCENSSYKLSLFGFWTPDDITQDWDEHCSLLSIHQFIKKWIRTLTAIFTEKRWKIWLVSLKFCLRCQLWTTTSPGSSPAGNL